MSLGRQVGRNGLEGRPIYIREKAEKLTKGGETYMFFHPFSNFTNHLFILGILGLDSLGMVGKVCKFPRHLQVSPPILTSRIYIGRNGRGCI